MSANFTDLPINDSPSIEVLLNDVFHSSSSESEVFVWIAVGFGEIENSVILNGFTQAGDVVDTMLIPLNKQNLESVVKLPAIGTAVINVNARRKNTGNPNA